MALMLVLVLSCAAELRVSGAFGDHMVVQRDAEVRVWGWSDAGDELTVSFAGQVATSTAGEDGGWIAQLGPMPANATGRELKITSGDKSIALKDVLVGEVWHASGQSNMGMRMNSVAKRLESGKADIAAAAHPAIRWRQIGEGPASTPKDNLPGKAWTVCSPDTASESSAAAFYFARKLHRELKVPVGIIDTSRGGTPIEPFIPRAAFTGHPTLEREAELGDADDLAGIWRLPGGVRARDANWLPGRLFNSRLAPLSRFRVRGAIWYQGESNSGVKEDPRDYQHKMRALVEGWREAFSHKDMPVYFVQLPGSGAGPGWPYLREQQRLSSAITNTGMVVTIDLLDADIHPPNKFDVGERLARWALAKTSGPMYKGFEVKDGRAHVTFEHGDGLMLASKDGLAAPIPLVSNELPHLNHVELAGKDKVWHPAQAVVLGGKLVAHSVEVPNPAAVRYGYEPKPQTCYLYNRAGLPASPFCSHPEWLVYDPELPE